MYPSVNRDPDAHRDRDDLSRRSLLRRRKPIFSAETPGALLSAQCSVGTMRCMKPTVYLETTIPSYLAARPSRDLVASAHQQVTHEWWHEASDQFEVFISEAVLSEIRSGDPEVASRRLQIVSGLPVLELTEDIRQLTLVYHKELELPRRAGADIVHIACAVSYELDYLLTWNCAHIANGRVIRRLMTANERLGRFTPLIVTPEELFETPAGEG